MEITAAVARRPHAPFSVERVNLEEPREDEILVKIHAVGLCHTDLVCRDQALPVPQPVVLGHEGAGVVEQVGRRVSKVRPGDHVVLTFNACGTCPSCLEGGSTYCHDFFGHNFAATRADGSTALSKDGVAIHSNFFGQSSFASYALAHERNVVKVRPDAPLELLGPLGCGIQTGAGSVINALRARAGSSIAIFGGGSVGLSAVLGARVSGCATIVVVDLMDSRLELARELGATHTVNPRQEENVVQRIRAITGSGVHYSLETTALPAVFRQAVDCLAPRGTCGLIGAAGSGTEVALDMVGILTQGWNIRGMVEGDSVPEVFIPQMIELYLQGRFPFDKLITLYPFEQINQAERDQLEGKVVKPVLRFGG